CAREDDYSFDFW
nr:immunoglobulin heavy chain junction region [Mus musculus]